MTKEHDVRNSTASARRSALSWSLLAACAAVAGVLALAGGDAAAQDSSRKGGDLIWAAKSRQVGGQGQGVYLYQMSIQGEHLYVSGNGRGGGAIVEKFRKADGSLVWDKPLKVDSAEGMSITTDSKAMYIAGAPWRAEKRDLDGKVIWSHVRPGGGKPYMIVNDDDSIYLAGNTSAIWTVERRRVTDGSVVWSKEVLPGVVLGAAIDDEFIYLGGYDKAPGNNQWRLEKRRKSDGELVWVSVHNPSDKGDQIYGVAVDATGVYATGYDTAKPGGQWRTEKRSLTDGSLIWQQTHDYTDKLDKAHGLGSDATGLYIPGYQGGNQWRIEKRSLTDGTLIWEAISVTGGRMWYAVAQDDEAVYVGGYVGGEWRIEKRAK